MTLSVVAGTNALFLGPPGTGKTAVVQRWARSFAANPGDVFDTLLTKFTRPAEVFGPIDIAALERGEQRTRTVGFLPAAKVGILDEVFKGSSAIINSLLRIANERQFADNGVMMPTPTRTLIGMSNEYPEDPALLAAFFDRFPIKVRVKALESADFSRMLGVVTAAQHSASPTVLADADFAEIDRLVGAVDLTSMLQPICEIRSLLAAKGVQISDRRWVQALRVIRASAVLGGRLKASRADLAVLADVCWNTEQDCGVIASILPDFLDPFARDIRAIMDDVYSGRAEIFAAANTDGKDSSRPNPDTGKAGEVALREYTRMQSATTRLNLIEPNAETDADRELLTSARASIEAVVEAVKLVAGGRSTITGLSKLGQSVEVDVAAKR